MLPIKTAVAGTIDSGDVLVTVEPGNGVLDLSFSSTVANAYGRQIKQTVTEVLAALDVTNAKIKVADKSAHDSAIRARLECALYRSCEPVEKYPWNLNKNPLRRPKPEKFRLRRTMMFLSAQKPSHIKDPTIYGEDSLMLDLEDAVAVGEKDAARFSMYHAMTSIDYGKTEMIVRINALDTPYWKEDIRACVAAGIDGVRIAKCESAQDVKTIEDALLAAEKEFGVEQGRTLIIAALETPLGILNAYQVATASQRLFGIAISGGDLRRTLQVEESASGIELLQSRGMVVLAARAAGVQCFDTVNTHLSDVEGFEKEVQMIKEMGFDGKSIVNPKQIAPVHKIFTPTEKEVEKAEKIVRVLCENTDKGTGVFMMDGKMLDIAFLPGAKRTLALAKVCGIYKGDLV